MLDKIKEFKPSSWAIDNKTSIYIITAIITLAGIFSYNSLPKEQFPEVVFPQIYVSTIYPGTTPTDMENLVTKHLEKKVKSIAGVKKITSNSFQDFSNVIIEFNTDVDVSIAKQRVKDKVDEARTDLPNDLPQDPNVIEVDVSQLPIMNINISGDFDLQRLKKYADLMQDKIEAMKEITRVDMVGALEREIQINVDRYKMEAAGITLTDIENAVKYENITISGGNIKMDEINRSISVTGEFKDIATIQNLIIRSGTGAQLYLKDIAEVKDGFEEKESFARLNKKNVITLNVIKRSGENLIDASDKIRDLSAELKATTFPEGVNVTITGDQSDKTRVTIHDLINTIIIGFILVTLILMFFMGATNAMFVGLSVPLSMFIAFLILPGLDFTLNMIVLFAFLLALGIVVDDAIVVVENTHRIFENGKVPITKAAKLATGEVFLPVLSGTLTTLAPFIPLAFWQGVIGKFMFFLPVTLIVTLLASLVVAYIINPVFAVDFMKPHHPDDDKKPKFTKGFKITTVVFAALALIFYAASNIGMGNFVIFLYLCYTFHRFVLEKIIRRFQERTWPSIQNRYERFVTRMLKGFRPHLMLLGTTLLLIASFIIVGIAKPKVVFFPKGDPNFVYVYVKMPIGTNQIYTDSITKIVENKVYQVVGEKNKIVESIISNVAVGAGDPRDPSSNAVSPNLGKVTVAFVTFEKRGGQNTRDYLDKIRDQVKGIPGAEITVDQEQGGPPTGKPVNIEISGDNLKDLVVTATRLKQYIDSLQIYGIEELKKDIESSKPEIKVFVNRDKAAREGISTAQIGMSLRTALFGKEVSKFKDDNDDYPIELRFTEEQRNDVSALMNMKMIYRDMNMGGQLRQVPLSAIADIKYENSFGGIKRKNQKRVVTLSSNVLSDANANTIVGQIKNIIPDFKTPEGVTIDMTGEQEDQKETGSFLGKAMMISLGLIFLILVTQFNSLSKPVIILSEILFSVIGVLLGFSFTGMSISIIMTGIGVIALAGIVVRNGILLVEFTEILLSQGYEIKAAVIEAGKTRMTPVILTACATILGLIPLAIGLNIDFVKLFTHLNPNIYFGGDSVAFWGPLSWTMIFGLSFATLLTLFLVPAMLLMTHNFKLRVRRWRGLDKVKVQDADADTAEVIV
ncbi:MAG: efflux RND transporter permease subunit [Bacteroidia bacterium]|nr:efflux RND transporter permease subunit [Bacteroidia bacterium]